MNTTAIEINIAPPPPQNPGGQTAPSSNGGSFQDHLGRALSAGAPTDGENSQYSSPSEKSVRSDKPQFRAMRNTTPPNTPSNPTTSAVSNSASPAVVGAASNPSSPTSEAIQSNSTGMPGASQPLLSGNDPQKVNPSPVAWLMEMLPAALFSHTGDLSPSQGSSTPGSGQPQPAPGTNANEANLSQAINTLLNGAGSNTANPQAQNTARSPSAAASANTFQSDSTGTPTTSINATTPQDGTKIQQEVASLERMSLSSLAVSTAAGGGPLPASSQSKTDPPSSLVAVKGIAGLKGNATTVQPKLAQESPSQTSAALSAGAAQASSSHDDSLMVVKAASGSSGDTPKNGTPQDPKSSTFLTTDGSANPTANSAASPASVATQIAANNFPMALNQAAAAGNSPPHANMPAQSAAPQAVVADKLTAAADNPVSAQGSVNAATLLQTQGRAEMHVALQTDNMGALQLHAVLDGGRVGASISVVSHEAHTLLSNELPALQQVLTDQNLRVDHLTVINSPMSSGTNTGNGRGFHSGNFNQPSNQAARWFSSSPAPLASGGTDQLPQEEIRRRLSVRA